MRKRADDTSAMTLFIIEKWARREYDDAIYKYRTYEFIDKEEASYWLGRANVIEEMFNLVNDG